jgi:hypothetical protein
MSKWYAPRASSCCTATFLHVTSLPAPLAFCTSTTTAVDFVCPISTINTCLPFRIIKRRKHSNSIIRTRARSIVRTYL